MKQCTYEIGTVNWLICLSNTGSWMHKLITHCQFKRKEKAGRMAYINNWTYDCSQCKCAAYYMS